MQQQAQQQQGQPGTTARGACVVARVSVWLAHHAQVPGHSLLCPARCRAYAHASCMSLQVARSPGASSTHARRLQQACRAAQVCVCV
jgi:hypothetical protein